MPLYGGNQGDKLEDAGELRERELLNFVTVRDRDRGCRSSALTIFRACICVVCFLSITYAYVSLLMCLTPVFLP